MSVYVIHTYIGDLNTLSPLDHASYTKTGLEAELARTPRLSRKFLRPRPLPNHEPASSVDSSLPHTLLDYTPMMVTRSLSRSLARALSLSLLSLSLSVSLSLSLSRSLALSRSFSLARALSLTPLPKP
jgi:hypothetical protein